MVSLDKYTRADITNIAIPEKMSLSTDLKFLTENDSEKKRSRLSQGSRMETHISMDDRKPARSSGSASRRHQRSVCRPVGLDSPGAPETLQATRGAGERPGGITYCTLPTKRQRHRERDAKRRKDLQRHGGKPTKRWKEEVHTFGSSTRC